MNILYRLSQRQEDELFERGTELTIALPIPFDERTDWCGWAKSVLPKSIATLVTSAEEGEVWVHALKKIPKERQTLSEHLGGIVDRGRGDTPDPESPVLAQCVVVIVVVLTPPNKRHTSSIIQWPKFVEFGEKVYP